jgi:hypothetical protein
MTTEEKPKRTIEEITAEIDKMIPIFWEIIDAAAAVIRNHNRNHNQNLNQEQVYLAYLSVRME